MRLADWDARLSAFLEARRARIFAWGSNDCALFVADGVLAMTGQDLAADFRGRYSTSRGSVRALRKWGAGTLEATVAASFADRPIGFARRGDIVMHDGALGICIGADAVFVGREGEQEGIVRFPRAVWQRAWAVD